MDRTNINRLLVYKTNGNIVDVTDNLTSLTMEKGSVEESGDTTADNPSTTINFTLKNTNNKQFSPHFEKGKYIYDTEYKLTLTGAESYNLPFPYTVEVISMTEGYNVQILNKKIYVDSWSEPLTGIEITLGIVCIDITVNNELNYVNDEFSPLIQVGNRVSWYRDIYKNSYDTLILSGQDSDRITFNTTKKVLDVAILGIYEALDYYTWCQQNYFTELPKDYFLTLKVTDTASTNRLMTYKEWLSKDYFTVLQDDYYKTLHARLITTGQAQIVEIIEGTNTCTIVFDRIIGNNEAMVLSVIYLEQVESFLKFDGYISQDPTSDIETCQVYCTDRAWDLQQKKSISVDSFRRYNSRLLSDNVTYEVLEEVIQVNLNNKTANTTYMDYTALFTQGQALRLYDEQDYIECTVSSVTATQLVLTSDSTITDGIYSLWKVYNPGIYLPQFLYNCMQDRGLEYSVIDFDSDPFAILPKTEELEFDDLWNMFQDYLTKTSNILWFRNVNGSFQLCLDPIPLEFSTPKYTLTSDDFWDEKNYGLRGADVRTSWTISYQLLKDGEYTTDILVVDDFTKSNYSCIIPTERMLMFTDELLSVNDFIRIGTEYYKIKQVKATGVYILNKPVGTSGTYDFYIWGEYSQKVGNIKQAIIALDNTSAIDTVEEAQKFGELLLYQTKEPYAIYKITLNADDYELNNFDTINVTCPEFSLYNENVFVQSVNESYAMGSNKLTITFSKKQQLGKFKFKEMITERGLNQVVTSNKITTTDIFPPPQKLTALEPTIDDLNDYNVYSYVYWNDFIGRTVAQWEIQYSTSETFDTYETITQNTTSLKLFLKEQKKYYIRVRGVGKEQVKGQWATTTVDASKYLIENPIQNRTWYIRLFAGNDEVEYFSQFYKLGYNKVDLLNSIDTIEIIPNADKGINAENHVTLSKEVYLIYPDTLLTGLIHRITAYLETEKTNKNLILRPVPNGYYKVQGDYYPTTGAITSMTISSKIDTEFFKNIDGISTETIIKPFNSIATIYTYNEIDSEIKTISNIKVIVDKNNYDSRIETQNFLTMGIDGQASIEYENVRTSYENMIVEFKNWSSNFGLGFFGTNKTKNCQALNCEIGFNQCKGLEYNTAINCTRGYDISKLLYKNNAKNCVTKYKDCYSSLSSNATYLIATTGSDNVNGGFNV